MADVTEKIYASRIQQYNSVTKKVTDVTAEYPVISYYVETYEDNNTSFKVINSQHNIIKAIFDAKTSQYASTKKIKLISQSFFKSYAKSRLLRQYIFAQSGWEEYAFATNVGNVTEAGAEEPTKGQVNNNFENEWFQATYGSYIGITQIKRHERAVLIDAHQDYNAVISVYGVNSELQNRPYAYATWEDVIPTIVSASPVNTYVDSHRAQTFYVQSQIGQTESGVTPTYTQKIIWRVKNSSTEHSATVVDGQVNFEANTFPENSEIEWCVEYNTQFGATSRTAWADISTVDLAPVIDGLVPSSNAFVDRTIQNTFSFNNSIKDIEVTNVMKWRQLGSSTEHTIQAGATTATVPANTFGISGDIQWRIESTTEYGEYGASEWVTITTNDVQPEIPTYLSPQNITVLGDKDNIFYWQHNSPTNTIQTKAELQKSTDGATWGTLATVTGASQEVLIPANTFTTGTAYWRVRTFNIDNEASEWSVPVRISIQTAPPVPSITMVDSKPQLSVNWQSQGQLAYRVTIEGDSFLYDTGEQYGNAKTFKYSGVLADSDYTLTVYVANRYGWSQTSTPVSVRNIPFDDIVLSVNGKALEWENASDRTYYVVRDGEPICKTTNKTYIDLLGNGFRTYEIVTLQNGYYSKSNSIAVEDYPTTASMIDVETGEEIELRIRKDAPPEVNRSIGTDYSLYWFAGSDKPTAYSRHRTNQSFSIAVTYDRLDDIHKLMNKTVLVKDKTGWRMFAIIDSVNYNISRYTDVEVNLVGVDYNEVIDYE